jgi:predicted branched-subunit amino acid permease
VSSSRPAPRLGRADAAALALTFFSLGVTLQVLLIDRGASLANAFVASAVIWSATSQFAYLAVRDAGGGEWAAIIAGTVVAARFGILAMSLIPRLPAGRVRRSLAAVNAFDPNVAIAVQQPEETAVEREFWRVTAAMMIGWFSGLVVGTFVGNVVGDIERFGLDAVFPAALLAIIAGLLRQRDGLIAGLAGGLICLTLIPVAPAGVPIILSVLGAVIAAVVAARSRR